MYTADVSPDRHYHLQSEDANRRIDALLEQLRVPESTWPLYADLLTTALKMYEDGAGVADLRIANAAFKEIRYGFKVFAPWRTVPKITVFGSARTPRAHPISEQAYAFSKRITGAGWMVITGAGGGVMSSAQEGAGAERSFGLNIRLPFEQEANPWIADDPKLVSFKYFFTRKLFLVREAHAMAFLPGGFGTADEAFEALTLIQTGKSPVLPLVMLDEPGGHLLEDLRRVHPAGDGRAGHGVAERPRALPRHRRRGAGRRGGRGLLQAVPLAALRARRARAPHPTADRSRRARRSQRAASPTS